MHVTIDDAQKIIDAARKEAEKTKTKMCIAVVDSGANLKAFYRMDDAWVGSIDIAIKKAKTAVFFGMPTGQIGKLSQPGGSLYGIEHSNDGLITFPGGLPIEHGCDSRHAGIERIPRRDCDVDAVERLERLAMLRDDRG